jgi:hypothetical protein
MEEPNTGRPHFVPLDEMEERELRRSLLIKSRAGDTVAQATLFELYGVTVTLRRSAANLLSTAVQTLAVPALIPFLNSLYVTFRLAERSIGFLDRHAWRQPALPLHIILPPVPIPIRILFDGPMKTAVPDMFYSLVCHSGKTTLPPRPTQPVGQSSGFFRWLGLPVSLTR